MPCFIQVKRVGRRRIDPQRNPRGRSMFKQTLDRPLDSVMQVLRDFFSVLEAIAMHNFVRHPLTGSSCTRNLAGQNLLFSASRHLSSRMHLPNPKLVGAQIIIPQNCASRTACLSVLRSPQQYRPLNHISKL